MASQRRPDRRSDRRDSAMSEEEVVSEPHDGREGVETAGSGRLEDPPGTADGSPHDEDSSKPPQAAIEPNPGTAIASSDAPGAGADTPAPRACSSSTRKRDTKKKGRGGAADGEPAMSVEDLFVTISTVQVCSSCCWRSRIWYVDGASPHDRKSTRPRLIVRCFDRLVCFTTDKL